jgi:hypothetical protein
VGKEMIVQAEIALKALRAPMREDRQALAKMTIILTSSLTDIVAMHRGVLSAGGNAYFPQVQQEIGLQSAWTHSITKVR